MMIIATSPARKRTIISEFKIENLCNTQGCDCAALRRISDDATTSLAQTDRSRKERRKALIE
jgi:hypothetical protein